MMGSDLDGDDAAASSDEDQHMAPKHDVESSVRPVEAQKYKFRFWDVIVDSDGVDSDGEMVTFHYVGSNKKEASRFDTRPWGDLQPWDGAEGVAPSKRRRTAPDMSDYQV